MLLQHLNDFADSRKLLDNLPFKPKAVRWILTLDEAGKLVLRLLFVGPPGEITGIDQFGGRPPAAYMGFEGRRLNPDGVAVDLHNLGFEGTFAPVVHDLDGVAHRDLCTVQIQIRKDAAPRRDAVSRRAPKIDDQRFGHARHLKSRICSVRLRRGSNSSRSFRNGS